MKNYTDALFEGLLFERKLSLKVQTALMSDWHNKNIDDNTIVNLPDDELEFNYKICVQKDYNREADFLKELGKHRGQDWAFSNEKTILDYLKTEKYTESDFTGALFRVARDAPSGNYLINYALKNLPLQYKVHLTMIYIIICAGFGWTDKATELKDFIGPAGTPESEEIKKILSDLISKKSIVIPYLTRIRKLLNENIEVNLDEKIEKHDKLNPLLFDKNEHLKPEVRQKLLQIADEFIKGIKEDEVKFILSDIKIVGSNCSYNYNANSDLDLHIVANTSSLNCPDDLYPIIYNLYKSAWNNKFEPTIKGIPVELYVETDSDSKNNKEPEESIKELENSNIQEKSTIKEAAAKQALVSNGMYSVLDDKWLKKPVIQDIPEVNQKEIDKALSPWLLKYTAIIKAPSIEAIDNFMDELYKARQTSIKLEGEYNPTNHAFKTLRAAGQLDNLRELKRALKEKELSLE